MVLLGATIGVIATIGTFAMYRAIKPHTQSLESRSQLLERLLNEEIEVAESIKDQRDTGATSTSICTTLLRHRYQRELFRNCTEPHNGTRL